MEVTLITSLVSHENYPQHDLIKVIYSCLLQHVPGIYGFATIQTGPSAPWAAFWTKPNMFWTVCQQCLEEALTSFSGLQVAFGKAKTDGSMSHVLTLLCQLAVWSTKHFKNIHTNTRAFHLSLTKFEFLRDL